MIRGSGFVGRITSTAVSSTNSGSSPIRIALNLLLLFAQWRTRVGLLPVLPGREHGHRPTSKSIEAENHSGRSSAEGLWVQSIPVFQTANRPRKGRN